MSALFFLEFFLNRDEANQLVTFCLSVRRLVVGFPAYTWNDDCWIYTPCSSTYSDLQAFVVDIELSYLRAKPFYTIKYPSVLIDYLFLKLIIIIN